TFQIVCKVSESFKSLSNFLKVASFQRVCKVSEGFKSLSNLSKDEIFKEFAKFLKVSKVY
ncbi:hypothetical protein DAPPUDRAFT_71423, partial [Daphnia pulex]